MHQNPESLRNQLAIIWTIASKDILDAFRSRLLISIFLASTFILLMPKILPWMFNPPSTYVPLFDPGDSSKISAFPPESGLVLQKVSSLQELENNLCSSTYPTLGLVVPLQNDPAAQTQTMTTTQQVDPAVSNFLGYVCWGDRFQATELETQLETRLTQEMGQAVTITAANRYTFPEDSGLNSGLGTINSVVMLLLVGIGLVPHLLFEEKQTRTLDALLVSPATIGQVVIGKAVTGFIFVLLTAGVVFAINWVDVVHWEAALLFALAGGVFSVSLGLVLGSLYENQQDVIGWMSVLLLALIGAIFLHLMRLDLPTFIQSLLPWMPSVAMGEIFQSAFQENISLPQMTANLITLLTFSLPLYAFIIWKVRRSDR